MQKTSTIKLDSTANPWIPAGNTTKSNKEDTSTTNTDSTKEKKNDKNDKHQKIKSISTRIEPTNNAKETQSTISISKEKTESVQNECT